MTCREVNDEKKNDPKKNGIGKTDAVEEGPRLSR